MTTNKPRGRLMSRFIYDGSFKFMIAATGLAAGIHWVSFIMGFVAFRRQMDSATMVITDWDPSVLMMHIRIGLALLISVAGLWSRRRLGLFLSALALAWAIVEYVGWYIRSVRVRVNAGVETFPTSVAQFLNLYGATAWNAVVLVLVISVLVWEIRQLIRIVTSEPIQRPDSSEVGR